MAKNFLSKLPPNAARLIKRIGKEADLMNKPAYLVGGSVRDLIFSRKNFDIDIVIEGNAIALAKVLAKGLNASLKIYKQFRTATLTVPNFGRIDLASARKEMYPYAGSLPKVCSGKLYDDLFRRDFTINTMAIGITRDYFGALIDRFGGLEDLKRKKIRILHKQSFMDDPTRILRAIRFEQRFLFKIERQTYALLVAALNKKAVRSVKPPRYFAEFQKMFYEARPYEHLKRLNSLGGLSFISAGFKPDVRMLKKMESNIQKLHHNIIYKNFCQWWLVYFMGLTEPLGKAALETVLTKFQLRKETKKSILQSRQVSDIISILSQRKMDRSRIFRLLRPLEDSVILLLRVKTLNKVINRRIDWFWKNDRHVKLKITGNDLKRLEVLPGKRIGAVLDYVLDQKINHRLKTKGSEIKAAIKIITKV